MYKIDIRIYTGFSNAISGFEQNLILTSLGHTMCGSMADIQSAVAEIRQGKKKKERTNDRMKI